MESVASLTQSPISEVLTLARRFEPVLRYTEGELFLPMPVERYVEAAALFRRVPGQKAPELVMPATKINLSTLVSYARPRRRHGPGAPLRSEPLESGGVPPLATSPGSRTVPGWEPLRHGRHVRSAR